MALLPQARELCTQYESFCAKVDELTDLRGGLTRIGFAVRSFDRAPLTVRRFLDYLPCRSEET